MYIKISHVGKDLKKYRSKSGMKATLVRIMMKKKDRKDCTTFVAKMCLATNVPIVCKYGHKYAKLASRKGLTRCFFWIITHQSWLDNSSNPAKHLFSSRAFD